MRFVGNQGFSRRALLRGAFALGGSALAGAGTYAYARLVEPRRLGIERVTLPLRGLPAPLAGLRVAQLSDVHLGPLVPADVLRVAVEAVMSLEPDLIALTGDYATRLDGGELAILEAELVHLSAPLGIYAIMGNHDIWVGAERVARIVERAGGRLLRNSSAVVERGGAVLHVVGVDDVLEERDDLPLALAEVPDDAIVLLLAHEPDFADEAALDPRIRAQLSGHSHGGQVKVPGLPRVLPPLAEKYPEGLYRVGGLSLYTSRGIGVIRPGVRLNCPPEVTLLELAPA